MNLSLIFDLVMGFGQSFLTSQGRTRESAILRKLQESKQSGANVDAALQRVADSLNADEELDWDSLEADIDAAVAEFTGATDPA